MADQPTPRTRDGDGPRSSAGYGSRGRGRGRNGSDRGRGRGGGGRSDRQAPEKRQRMQHQQQHSRHGASLHQQSRALPRKWMAYAPPLHSELRVPLAPPTFRVMSFNTLADYLATKDDILSTPQGWIYEWSHRGSRLVREIVAHAPQIVCLQEVDHFDDFFEPELRKHGYVGIYKRRTGEETHDGCAIFVKRDAFTIVSSHPIEFYVAGHPVLDRDNVALAAVLEWRNGNNSSSDAPPQRLLVATTHVLFNPKRGDVKLAQLEMLTRTLSELRAAHAQPDSTAATAADSRDSTAAAPPQSLLPVLLSGDFNLEPHSALYDFLATGSLRGTGLNRTTLSGQQDNDNPAAQKAKFVNENDTSRHFGHGTAYGRYSASETRRKVPVAYRVNVAASHDLDFASAYAQSPDAQCTGEPKFTIFHSGAKGAVDYMWFTHTALHCHGVLEMAPAGLLFAHKALPTPQDASDHLSLVADFSLRAMHA